LRLHHYVLFVLIVYSLSIHLALGDTPPKQKKPESYKYLTSAAKRPAKMPGDEPKIYFTFDESAELKAWLKENGEWHLEGWIKHNRFRCGTYRLGLRFGKGDFGCANISWMTEPQYIDKKTQCNQSQMHYSGYNTNQENTLITSEVTCAQLVIQCTGICN
jgi:hypothetical protein